MKILILSHSSDLAGAESSMLDLFDFWSKFPNIDPVFIIRKPVRSLAQELAKRNFKYYPVYYTNWAQRNPSSNPADIYWYAKQNSKAVVKIEKIINKEKPDIVMTNTSVAPWAAIAAKNKDLPHIWFVREFGNADHDFAYKLGIRKSFEIIGELSELVVVNSESLANFVTEYINKNKVAILYPNINLEKIAKLAKVRVNTPFKHQDSLKLVITGRISPSKGQFLAAEAVGILSKQGLNCELCIVGNSSDKEDESSLREIINKYDIADRVHIVGYKTNPFAYVTLADIGITSSTKEAFGRVTLEYMALGKPVIGADSGGTSELIKVDYNGYLFRENDSESLAEALINYIKNRNLVKLHGKNSSIRANQLMDRYTPVELYKKIQKLLKDSSSSQKKQNNKELLKFPILLDQRQKKRDFNLAVRYPRNTINNILKSIYLRIK